MPDSPTQLLVGNMPPYERINAYRPPRRGSLRRWFAAALPWVFVFCVAAGTMLPVRDWVRRSLPGSVDSQAARDAEIIWKRGGNSDVRHPVDVIRTIDGDTFEARVHLGPGLDPTTRVRLRGIDAPELKASCPQLQRRPSQRLVCKCRTSAAQMKEPRNRAALVSIWIGTISA